MEFKATFDANTDSDWFSVQLFSGVTYHISLSPDESTGHFYITASSETDSEFAIDSHNRRTESDSSGTDLVFTPLTDGVFYIDVGHSDKVLGTSGSTSLPTIYELDLLAALDPAAVQLLLAQLGFDSLDNLKDFIGSSNTSGSTWPLNYGISVKSIVDDYADNVATTGRISSGSSVQGRIDATHDSDWFKAELSAGVTYEFTLESSDLKSLNLSGFDVGKNRIEMSDFNPLGTSTLVVTPDVSGTFIIDVDAAQSNGAGGTYTLSLNSIHDDFADTRATTGNIAVGGSVSGTLNAPDDADVFKTVLAANTTYQISSTVADSTLALMLGMNSDDSNGLSIAGFERFDFGANKSITFSTLNGGDYFIRMEQLAAGSKSTAEGIPFSAVNYDISVSAVVDDYYDTVNTSGVVSVGSSAAGVLEVENDNDWFKANLSAGTTYQAKVVGANPGGQFGLQALSDNSPHTLIDSVGRFEGTGGVESQLVFTPRQSGDFYFDVSSFNDLTGAYSLELSIIDDDYADTVATQGLVSVGSSLSGKIDAVGDKDWIAVDLQSDITYQIKLSSTGAQSLYLYSVEDSEYSAVAEADEARLELSNYPEIVFTPNDDARYYIEVRDSSSTITDYTVSVAAIEDDYPDHDQSTAVLVVDTSGGGTVTPPSINLTKTQVSELYVAIFNRASEGSGNQYWQGTGMSVEDTATTMLATADAQAYFGGSLDSDRAFIEHIYLNTLNKTPADDAAGIDYWLGTLANGDSRGHVISALVSAAQQPENAGAAQDLFNERLAISNYAADKLTDAPDNYGVVLGFNDDLNGLTLVGGASAIIDSLL